MEMRGTQLTRCLRVEAIILLFYYCITHYCKFIYCDSCIYSWKSCNSENSPCGVSSKWKQRHLQSCALVPPPGTLLCLTRQFCSEITIIYKIIKISNDFFFFLKSPAVFNVVIEHLKLPTETVPSFQR